MTYSMVRRGRTKAPLVFQVSLKGLAGFVALAVMAPAIPFAQDAGADDASVARPDSSSPDSSSPADGDQETLMAIASGVPTGLYFPVAGSVARVLAESGRFDGLSFAAETTTGAWENAVRVNTGEFDLGIVRSDRVFDAVMGTGPFAASGPLDELRLLFALHDEPVTLIARADTGAETFLDLASFRINTGPEDNPVHVALTAALEAAQTIFAEAGTEPELLSLPLETQHEALCNDEVDAIAYVAGHPTGTVRNALALCGAVVIGFDDDIIDAVLAGHPYYKASSIPLAYYMNGATSLDGEGPEVRTFGPVALMVTHEGMANDTAQAITAEIVDSLDALRQLHPALSGLSVSEILGSEFSAPLHDGALDYFRETSIR